MSNEATPPTAATDNCDVMIVGLGPVGKLLAIHLGRAGHRVIVADRKTEGYPLPRAVTHDFEFARILQSIGLSPDTIPEITEPYDDMYVWRNADRQSLVEVDWSGIGSSGWYNTYFFSQPALEDRMELVLSTIPTVTVLRGWSADILSDDEVVSTGLTQVATGAQRVVTSRYLVGADGANSTVRRWAGIDWHDMGFFYDWLVVDVIPDPSLEFPHVAIQTCDIARPATMVPGGPGRRRWEFMRLPHETIESLNKTERAWELLEPFGIRPDNSELERHSVYTFQAGWATSWRRGHILLAGDAAHLMPPFAGQGLGAGLRDVMNLFWKLGSVLAGHATESVLDTYETERLTHIREFIDFSISLGRVICITDPAEAAERDERMIAELAKGNAPPSPPAPQLGPGLHLPGGGQLSPQAVIRVDDATVRFDDLYSGSVLLLAKAETFEQVAAETADMIRELGITVVALRGRHPEVATLDEVDGTYATWLDQLSAECVLIRPDFYTFGASNAAGMNALVLALREQLGVSALGSRV
ncbi:bifunctional 3-(3-hydroxy-phenyl)propionate/3-hydroxycinnamic acid hydroxylase [Salinibacterium sp. G-O1]|uniref:bifunctional 3-(3-hydroxy-phenyl)propionate/3-hydroxycinnamic acid hydroxylase MhpA n=1 Tax=Salinibacterium sp. G-O1 TaxID=3046208 RepID=UPI0024B98D62|nr:bifunctional 3-(3-hydroxy-phenyl)propionate/3-hydroxycinnamic acid hydroxylase [Salinibacterium sp. G-O1]MDJ0334392.1 bifunctional 3-(3-hydroxy-phenyl)propionate/3-hydroxycinnamic acid hydroxylase [Salinibacterium sp. G-O1]